MDFMDRRPAAKPMPGAMARLNGMGTRKDGMRTRQGAARMQGTHNDMQTGSAAMYTPLPVAAPVSRSAGGYSAQTVLPGVRMSQPGERTVAPVPMMHADQMRSNMSPLQMAANQMTARPQSGPEGSMMGIASTMSDVHSGQAAYVHQAPSQRPGMAQAQNVLPTGRRGLFGRMR